MADYDDPRPSAQEVGTTEQVVAKDNLITFDRFMNADSSETVTNRKGEVLYTPLSASEIMDGYIDEVENAKVRAIVDINSDVAKVEEAKEQAIVDMNEAVDEVSDIGEQAIADFESDGAQVISDFESDSAQAISDFETSSSEATNAAITEFENQTASAIAQAGYEVVGSFADGVTVANRAEAVYLSGDYEGFYVWTGTFPKTVTAGDSPFDEDGWMLAATGYVKQSSAVQLFGQTIDIDLSIPAGQNALSINPTVSDGVTVTVPSDSQYVILGSTS